MMGRIAGVGILALVIAAPAVDTAAAASIYDGSWSLTIVTERGACDRTYNFSVDITNGIVSHANLVRLRGRVARGGAVSVSVSVADKHASGSGRLSRTAGHGRWSGYAGSDRCSGRWTAARRF